MKLTIKLKDPKSCWSCPCLSFEHIVNGSIGDAICGLGRKHKIKDIDNYDFQELIRPQKCIKENGR